MNASTVNHILNVCAFSILSIVFGIIFGVIDWGLKEDEINPIKRYGIVATIAAYTSRVLIYLNFHQCICVILCIICFNYFKTTENLRIKYENYYKNRNKFPKLCFRVPTRGYYPELVQRNVKRNIDTCLEVGLMNFEFEIVTDIPINHPRNPRVREILVPPSYCTKNGTLFKARALQYCLEPDIDRLNDQDWIIHLDEESLLSPDCIRGIINFCVEGKYDFGQGLITYSNDVIVNPWITLWDSIRVGNDIALIGISLKTFHKPLFGWNGSYMICRCSAERQVTWDFGKQGSVREDIYFSLMAWQLGFSFGWCEGEMWEKSPFSTHDYLIQRVRNMQGSMLVVFDTKIKLQFKMLFALWMINYGSIAIISAITPLLWFTVPLPYPQIMKWFNGFLGGILIYQCIFGVIIQYHRKCGNNPLKLLCYLLAFVVISPFGLIMDLIVPIRGILEEKVKFNIVNKDPMRIKTNNFKLQEK